MKPVLIKPLAALLLTGATALCATSQARSPKEAMTRNLDIFTALYKSLQTTYVDTIDADKSMRTAIDAMLSDIDPYTEYFPEDERDELLSISTGEFGGIGAYIQQNKAGNTVVSLPQPGTPAERAGLKAGDIFITVDGDTVLTLGSDKVRERLRGQAGTDLTVRVRRPYAADSILDITLTRAKIDINPVPFYGMTADSVGYIQLTTFNEKSVPAVSAAIRDLTGRNARALILDLRGNGGGIMEGAVDLVGLFVPKGTEVLRTRGRDNASERIYKTSTRPLAPEIPLAVLIDGGSASSSEITAGALQDLDRAVIIGSRSYGKGLVQSSRLLPYGGVLKVTVAKYYIPSGRLIQAIDYSRRNPDGSVARTPDSLTNVFHTRAGRPVRDGGGITPDSVIPYPEVNRLTYNIVRDQIDFDFATRYAATHKTVAPPSEFVVDDSIFNEFKAFINPETLQYDKVCETIADNLEEAARVEGYLNDEVEAQIKSLKSLLRHDLDHDLDFRRESISDYLGAEILERYYSTAGAAEYNMRRDPEIAAAAAIITDPELTARILSGNKK